MSTMQLQQIDEFDRLTPKQVAGTVLMWTVGVLLLAAFIWFVYLQLTAVRGVKVEAPSPQVVSMLPPPPPPPPPPPEPKEKPPEPTEQPQPSPAEAPKTPQQQQQAAPVSINAPAQAGTDSFGLSAGNGAGIGSPSSGGTCLGTKCGSGPVGTGVSEPFYRRYLSSALQERVQGDDKLGRLVFSADFTLTVTPDGRVSGVQFVGARGRRDDGTMQRLAAILAAVRGLDPPPQSMRFPQKVTVRGLRAF
jgi:periplasmic protein TonB